MKRFSLLMLLAASVYALTGCILTDYPCITDSENPDYATCGSTSAGILHDTQGWAHLLEYSQSASDNNGDGIYSTFLTFVSQDSSGNQMIATTANTGTDPAGAGGGVFGGGGPPLFHSDSYAQPGQKGIGKDAIFYAVYTNSVANPLPVPGCPGCPTSGGFGATGDLSGSCLDDPALDEFPNDYFVTTACDLIPQLDMSFVQFGGTDMGVAAGRSELTGRGTVPLAMKVGAIKDSVVTADGLRYTLDASKVRLTAMQGSLTRVIDLSAVSGLSIMLDPSSQGVVGNKLAHDMGLTPEGYYAIASQLASFRRAVPITLRIEAYGATWDYKFALSAVWSAEATAEALAGFGTTTDGTGRRRD